MKTDSSLYLQEVYEKLDFQAGVGFYSLTNSEVQPALSKIGWIEQARKLKADAIFFVGDYPAVLFFKLDNFLETDTQGYEDEIRELYLKVWNTSQVPLFFVALPFEIRVYSAYQKPVNVVEQQFSDRWLGKVKEIVNMEKDWQDFSRAEVESGRLFQKKQKNFRKENRVDRWLLQNLSSLRQKLIGENLQKREYVHALIGRSIFIRYLEDRSVLVKDYFIEVNSELKHSSYVDVLRSKDDTYALFAKLRKDFNGDLFPLSDAEKASVSAEDLELLGKFLSGRSMGEYPDLLFWAYRFDFIPIELISNIYEEFYYENGGDKDKGTHYTPTTLVNFVLSQCLTPERLDNGARILDPACGSGIFLVEAFKRIVYHECQRKGIRVNELPVTELTHLLTEQITGIDINRSAIQVAAFSLYLAFLDFRNPPDIRQNKKLPKLIYDPQLPMGGKNLFVANAFSPTRSEQIKFPDQPVLPFDNGQFDVIVGNPPWGEAEKQDGEIALEWCKAFGYLVGDKEWSQCFIWRTQHLLKSDGEIGLLVSTGVLFKHAEKSKVFRQKWLSTNQVRAVYNFAHVREVFFRKQKKDAISPFAAIFFTPALSETIEQNKVAYIAIKQSVFVEQLQAVMIDKTDLHRIYQNELLVKDWLWKTYMWAGLADADLIDELKDTEEVLGQLVGEYSRGFKESAPQKNHTRELGVEWELSVNAFKENADFAELVIPLRDRKLHRLGKIEIYQGPRLIIKRGISHEGNKSGEIRARLAYIPFAFPSSLIGFRLDELNIEKQEILLGIINSSLAKYYHFLTCSTWGFWRYEIHEEEHLNLPIRFSENHDLQQRIRNAVHQLTTQSGIPSLLDSNTPTWRSMQDELDEAIFDLYELSEPQRDLIRDLCQTTLEFFYEGADSQAVKPPTVEWLEAYRNAFLETWIDRLAPKGVELEIRIFAPHHGLLCGIAFELKEKGTALDHLPVTDDSEWQYWFMQLSKTLRQESTKGIYINQVLKEVSESGMFLVKRAERRFWTKSQARQDAQELLIEVFKLEWQD